MGGTSTMSYEALLFEKKDGNCNHYSEFTDK